MNKGIILPKYYFKNTQILVSIGEYVFLEDLQCFVHLLDN